MRRASVWFFGTRNVRAGVVFCLTIAFMVGGAILVATTNFGAEVVSTIVFPLVMFAFGFIAGDGRRQAKPPACCEEMPNGVTHIHDMTPLYRTPSEGGDS